MKNDTNYEELNRFLIFSSDLTNETLVQLYDLNKGFLRQMISRYCFNLSDYDDYMQIGYFGLVKAVQEMRRKHDYAGSFVAYYKQCLQGLFYRYNKRFQYSIKVPVKVDFEDVQIVEVDNTMLDLEDDIDVEDYILHNELREILEKSLKCLTKENAWIIKQVYFINRTMSDVGKELGISRDAVSKRISRSLRKLRNDPILKQIN